MTGSRWAAGRRRRPGPTTLDRVGPTTLDRVGPTTLDRVGPALDRVGLALAAAAAVLLAGVLVVVLADEGAGSRTARVGVVDTVVPEAARAALAVPQPELPDPGPGGALRARPVSGALTVRAAAALTARVVTTLPPPLGSARVLLVLAVRGDWVRVALPIRPDGSTGWVRRAEVVLEAVRERPARPATCRSPQRWRCG
jgi:hypothetical protein